MTKHARVGSLSVLNGRQKSSYRVWDRNLGVETEKLVPVNSHISPQESYITFGKDPKWPPADNFEKDNIFNQ